jgi:hypothetical protein
MRLVVGLWLLWKTGSLTSWATLSLSGKSVYHSVGYLCGAVPQILGFVTQRTSVIGNTWLKHVGFFNLSLLLTPGLFSYKGSPLSFFDSYVLPFFLFLCFLYFYLPSFILSFLSLIFVCPVRRPLHCLTLQQWKLSITYCPDIVPFVRYFPGVCVCVCLITPCHSKFFVADKVTSRTPSWSDPHVTSPWQQADKSTSPMTGNRQQCLSITDVSIRECESTQWRFVPV